MAVGDITEVNWKKDQKETAGSDTVERRVMPCDQTDPEDCKRLEVSEGELLPCPFCGGEAQLWQYKVSENYLKAACCSSEDCPMENPGGSFEAQTKREACALWNKRA